MDSTVEWAAVCGNESLFWDPQLTLNTSSPDLTPCFQATILVWVPSAILWLCAVFYLPYLCHRPIVNKWNHKSILNWVKLIDASLLVAVSLIGLIMATVYDSNGDHQPLSAYLNYSVKTATFALATLLMHLEYSRGLHTSGPFFVFWVLTIVIWVVPFRSHIISFKNDQEDTFTAVTFFVTYGLMLIQFVLLFVPDLQALDDVAGPKALDEETTPLLGNQKPIDGAAEENSKRPCPETRVTFFSNVTHWWITRLILRGYRRPIVYEDLFDLLHRDKSRVIEPKFHDEWNKRVAAWRKTRQIQEDDWPDLNPDTEQTRDEEEDANIEDGKQKDSKKNKKKEPQLRKGPSLVMALFKTSQGPIVISAICRLFSAFWEFLNPILLQQVIDFVSGNDPFMWKGYMLAVALLMVNVINALVFHTYFKFTYITGMRTRSAVITAVYRKALKLSSASRRKTTVGEIVNLMSIDAQKMHDVCNSIHEVWACPILIIVAMVLLWNVIGPSSLAGLGLLLVMAPINGGALGRLYMRSQTHQMQHKDIRMKLVNEILSGIKVLKMYAWEPSFRESVREVRESELGYVKKQAYASAAIDVTWLCAPYLVTLAVFTTYVLSSPDNYLTPQIAFVSLSLIQMLNFGVSFLPLFITFAAQAYVSVKRVTSMLMQDEIDPDAVDHDPSTEGAVVIDSGTFSWGAERDSAVLSDINLKIRHEKLVAVVGQVGCGKSSLVSAVLGELKKLKGRVNVQGSIAYVAQQAWIQNATLKDNILFGKPFKQKHYDKVVDACALRPDFKILPSGDMTEIGEKGINLSGGQKQRVSLARAVYQNCDVYLLDDPLSAVDAHVGKHIFDNLVGPNGMLRNKTRLLVTHGVTYLPKVDEIVVLKNGRVSEVGTFNELLQREGAFADFIRTYLNESDESGEETDEEAQTKIEIQRQLSALSDGQESTDSHHLRRRLSRRAKSQGETEAEAAASPVKAEKEKDTLIEEEIAEVGTIKWSILGKYISSAGMSIFFLALVFQVVNIVAQVGTNIWLSKWSDDPIYEDATEARKQIDMRLGVYGALGAVQMIGTVGTSLTILLGGVVASRVMHAKLLQRILRAPMSFFDTTPLGRIVNRFSTDMDKLDTNIPSYTRFWFFEVAMVLSTLILICYSTPIFLAAIIPLAILYYILQRVYITALRQMKRIDSIRRSPIYVNFDETLVGVTCVRAFGEQKRFIAKNDRLVDDSQVAWYPILIAQRWIGFFLDAMGAFIVFFASLFAVLERDTITGGLAGLSVTFAMQATYVINMMVRGATELETHVVSVERVQEYSEIPSEAPWEMNDGDLDDEWPAEGSVQFESYNTRYRPGLDLVLHEMSFTVSPGEKVGIVGRTGAGKSSMALSLFRIIEAAGGKITIDGIDISTIGLHDLRGRLTIIPQDPVIFSGSLRKNLDPFHKHTDQEIWQIIEHAHLKTFVAELPDKLEHDCGEGGEALSVGQRQLVCLARALLRKSKILVLDEATAAVDMETDDLIQHTIQTEFKGCTVLTVAHRLNTILEYDRVMVLDKGVIKESGAPNDLLKAPDSAFYGMAKDAGLV